jgi:periplasmic divalent cation tolerance protein
MPDTSQHQVVLCTCPDSAQARRIADALVGEKLAACVNILPGLTSVYEWKGKLAADDEVLLIIKTAADRSDAMARRIAELHPYEVPEVVALPIVTGLEPYLHWITEETRPHP